MNNFVVRKANDYIVMVTVTIMMVMVILMVVM